MAPFVRTLTGDVSPDALGRTLIHEHLTVDWGEMLGRPKKVDFDPGALIAEIVGKLERLADLGVTAMAECTPYGCGRYVDLFAEVARRAPVRIVASTGFFHESWCPMHPLAVALDVDGLTDLFVREITEGMGGTLLRAGLIKTAAGDRRISPNEEKVIRAAARARRATGCPILIHTTALMGPELLDLVATEGLAPDEVIISHVGHEPDPRGYAAELFRRGTNVSFDRVGFHAFGSDKNWLDLVAWAVGEGWIDQVFLSHDASTFNYGLELADGADLHSDYGYISRVFVPALLARGLTVAQVDTILAANPQRALTFAG
jgi:phosphotriesterase-related protein